MNSKLFEEIVVPGITATYIKSDGLRFPIGLRFSVAEMSEGATFTVYKKNGQLRLEAGNTATGWDETKQVFGDVRGYKWQNLDTGMSRISGGTHL